MERRVEELNPKSEDIPEKVELANPPAPSSDRIIFEVKHPALAAPPTLQKLTSFEDLLNSLKSDDIAKRTDEFLKTSADEQPPTPRKILPAPTPQKKMYVLRYTIEGKMIVDSKRIGKGTIELLNNDKKTVFLVAFRNCIMNILFTGAFTCKSKLIELDTACKQTHENKQDFSIHLAQQPGGKIAKVDFCIPIEKSEEFLQEFSTIELEKSESYQN